MANAYVEVVPVTSETLMLPAAWATRQGVVLMDPDGWRVDNKSLADPITEAEFDERVSVSTIRFPARGLS